jgi:hypothetical protein
MADAPSGGGPAEDAFFIIGILIVLFVIWIARGGYNAQNLRGIFLAPPPPLGTGNSYGPQLQTASTTNQQTTTQHY